MVFCVKAGGMEEISRCIAPYLETGMVILNIAKRIPDFPLTSQGGRNKTLGKLLGEGIEGFKEGDRVFVYHRVPCFICHYCRRGSYTMCPTCHHTHLDSAGFAEYIRIPGLNVKNGGVIKLPDSVSFEEAVELAAKAEESLKGVINFE